MRSYTPATPASLLFECLVYDCKTDKERSTAINKILATTGGADTIVTARNYAKEKIAGLDTTIAQLEDKLDDLKDCGITKLPINVLTEHNLKIAIKDKEHFTPLYSAALASLDQAVKATNKKPILASTNVLN